MSSLLSAELSSQRRLLNTTFASVLTRALATDAAAVVDDAARDYLAFSSALARSLGGLPAATRADETVHVATWGSGECGQLGRALAACRGDV